MPNQQRKPARTKSKGSGFVFSTLSFIAICAALVFGMSVFFRVSNIEVSGAQRYSESEIIAASGIENGDNLMLVNRADAANKIYSKLLYIGRVTVSRKLPNTVKITVDESSTFAVVESEAGLWLVDQTGKLLDTCTMQNADSYIKVSGFSGVKPEKGKPLSVADEDKAKLSYLRNLMTAIAAVKLGADVSSIDLSSAANAELQYLDRFKVKLGADENLDYKLKMLLSVVAKLETEDKGTIDLSQGQKAQFSPG